VFLSFPSPSCVSHSVDTDRDNKPSTTLFGISLRSFSIVPSVPIFCWSSHSHDPQRTSLSTTAAMTTAVAVRMETRVTSTRRSDHMGYRLLCVACDMSCYLTKLSSLAAVHLPTLFCLTIQTSHEIQFSPTASNFFSGPVLRMDPVLVTPDRRPTAQYMIRNVFTDVVSPITYYLITII
jgi:hypothetical protein